MTALVSLLFITMIPIDFKITNFFLTLVSLLFNNYSIMIGELTSATSKERMTTNIFCRHHTHCNSKLRIHIFSPRYSVL